MFEVYYLPPTDSARESRLLNVVIRHNGRLDCNESPEVDGNHNVRLTYEFDSLNDAEAAAVELRSLGEYLEGPCEYG